jgi:hypothetical protein
MEYISSGENMRTQRNISVIPLKLYLHEHQLLWHYNKHLSVTIRRNQIKEGNASQTHGIGKITACEMLVGDDAVAERLEALHCQWSQLMDLNRG